jgi:hypothetical protein
MRKRLCLLLLGMAVSAAGLSAQGSANKSNSIVILGCLQGAQNAFTLKDDRSGVAYRIDADAESIAWHVGHQLEIHGTLDVSGGAPKVKPDQIIYVATKCAASGGTNTK